MAPAKSCVKMWLAREASSYSLSDGLDEMGGPLDENRTGHINGAGVRATFLDTLPGAELTCFAVKVSITVSFLERLFCYCIVQMA